MEIKVIARRWGNSLAVVCPKGVVGKRQIREDEPVRIIVEKARPKPGVLFGRFPELNAIPKQEMKDGCVVGWQRRTGRDGSGMQSLFLGKKRERRRSQNTSQGLLKLMNQ